MLYLHFASLIKLHDCHVAGCTVWSSSTSATVGTDRAKTLRSGAMEEGCRRKACHLIRVQFDLRWIELVLLMIFMHIFVWSHSGFELSRHDKLYSIPSGEVFPSIDYDSFCCCLYYAAVILWFLSFFLKLYRCAYMLISISEICGFTCLCRHQCVNMSFFIAACHAWFRLPQSS